MKRDANHSQSDRKSNSNGKSYSNGKSHSNGKSYAHSRVILWFWFKKLKLLLFLPAGLILFFLASAFPNSTESVYSGGIYTHIRTAQTFIASWAPFSIAESLVTGTVIYVVVRLVLVVFLCAKKGMKGKRVGLVTDVMIGFLSITAVVYFLFVLLWGMNYNRRPFADTAGIGVREVTVGELEETCVILINRANNFRESMSEDNGGVVALPESKDAVLEKSKSMYDNVREAFPTLDVEYSRPKPVVLSEAMSYAGITGIYFPLTGEANVNMKIGPAELPFTACHELAHQAGFAREDEANFIAWLVCDQSSDAGFRYSGTVMAMTHVLNCLRESDVNRWSRARELCSEGVNRDLNAQGQYWKRYEGPVMDISTTVNDTYLKANLQEEGVRSYGRMADLLIAYLLANK